MIILSGDRQWHVPELLRISFGYFAEGQIPLRHKLLRYGYIGHLSDSCWQRMLLSLVFQRSKVKQRLQHHAGWQP